MVTESKKNFEFDDRLDVPYLNKLYKGNFGHAEEMFEIYFSVVPQHILLLESALDREDHKSMYHISHKIIANTAYVGMAEVAELLNKIMNVAARQGEISQLKILISTLKEKEIYFRSIVDMEHKRLKSFLDL